MRPFWVQGWPNQPTGTWKRALVYYHVIDSLSSAMKRFKAAFDVQVLFNGNPLSHTHTHTQREREREREIALRRLQVAGRNPFMPAMVDEWESSKNVPAKSCF